MREAGRQPPTSVSRSPYIHSGPSSAQRQEAADLPIDHNCIRSGEGRFGCGQTGLGGQKIEEARAAKAIEPTRLIRGECRAVARQAERPIAVELLRISG